MRRRTCRDLYLSGAKRMQVPLSTVAKLPSNKFSPLTINHQACSRP